jgi:hypothetical protein
MTRVLTSVIAILILAVGVQAQTSPDAAELTRLLKEFLDGASRSDAAVHDRFWAEDLIYTGSSGRRIGKAEIMRDLRPATAPKRPEPTTTYSAEDIRIQQYGNAAIVAFRLIGTTTNNGKTQVTQYLNSGTFLKRNGMWQAVSWQATRMPRAGEEVKKEVSAIEAAFHQAILASDTGRLEALMDESFIWTPGAGEPVTRQQLLERLKSGQLKYSKLETSNVTVVVYGDSAIVRGVSTNQRRSISGSAGTGDSVPVTVSYTLTFINKGGDWKAVAMYSSQP